MFRPAPNNTYLTIHGCYIRGSELAIFFRICKIREQPITPTDQWFPKSQISKSFKVPKTDKDQNLSWLLVSEWIMGQKRLLNLPASAPISTHEGDDYEYDVPIDSDDISF